MLLYNIMSKSGNLGPPPSSLTDFTDLTLDEDVERMLREAQERHDARSGDHTEDEVAAIAGKKNIGTAAIAANIDVSAAAAGVGEDLATQMGKLSVPSALSKSSQIVKHANKAIETNKFIDKVNHVATGLLLLKSDQWKKGLKLIKDGALHIDEIYQKAKVPPCFESVKGFFGSSKQPVASLKNLCSGAAKIYDAASNVALAVPPRSIKGKEAKEQFKAELARTILIDPRTKKIQPLALPFLLFKAIKMNEPDTLHEVAQLMEMTQDEVELEANSMGILQARLDALRKGGKRKTRKYKKRRVKKSKTRKGKKSRKHKSKTHKKRKHRRGRKSRKH